MRLAASLAIVQAGPVLEGLYVQCAASKDPDLNLHRVGGVILVEEMPEVEEARIGAGIGIYIPVRPLAAGPDLDVSTRTRNTLLRSLRCLGERGFALLTGRGRTLRHITASPGRIGDIARAALVLTHFEYGYIT